MEKDLQIKETEKEIAELKAELIICCNAIKNCKDGEERKKLFEEKEEIKGDISDAENDLETLKAVITLKDVVEQSEVTEPEPKE